MAEKKFITGALLEHEEGRRCFLGYSYEMAFGGKNTRSICVFWIDDNGNILYSSSWYRKRMFKVIPSDIEANLAKIREYCKRVGGAPIGMRHSVAKNLGYTSIHTYASSFAHSHDGEIEL